MSLRSKEFLKKYTLLTIAFVCSLFIPYFLYSIRAKPLYHETKRPYEYPSMVKYSFKWPKTVAFQNNDTLVAPTNQNTQKEQEDIFREIDQKFCGQDRCRFLLPIAITEQGTVHKLYFHCDFAGVI